MPADEIIYRSVVNGQRAEVSVVDEPTRTYRLTVDGVPQSQICLADPTLVDFDYARHIARAIDTRAAAGIPLVFAHLGAGALTLPRYVQATRPGSVQYAVESEAERTIDVLGILPLDKGSDVRLLFGDARAIVDGRAGSDSSEPRAPWRNADVTVVDLWAGSTIGSQVASIEFYTQLESLCAPGGMLAVNLLDGPGCVYIRRQAAALGLLFDHVVVAMDSRMFDDTGPDKAPRTIPDPVRSGNIVLLASNRPLDLLTAPGWPVGDHNPPRVFAGDELRNWISGATPLTDSDATDSPSPSAGDHVGDGCD
ncbi:hypothetical protein B7R21_05330 [Subtercola boreus]|uniref:Spermine synthase n=1 Tax=Subtercola boreus TaxID=120213 RepID=A0A3E0W0S6_9MICO|nr:hypothetical protein [Subtercola boreus]RFA15435.1 hypothetical protein B7R21_05330 [Subtercola boreus]